MTAHTISRPRYRRMSLVSAMGLVVAALAAHDARSAQTQRSRLDVYTAAFTRSAKKHGYVLGGKPRVGIDPLMGTIEGAQYRFEAWCKRERQGEDGDPNVLRATTEAVIIDFEKAAQATNWLKGKTRTLLEVKWNHKGPATTLNGLGVTRVDYGPRKEPLGTGIRTFLLWRRGRRYCMVTGGSVLLGDRIDPIPPKPG
jgi:hypothetical protein